MENKKYKYRTTLKSIEKIEIVNDEPEHVVYIDSRGNTQCGCKLGNLSAIHDTFDEAKKFLINKLTVKLTEYNKMVRETLEIIKKVQELKEN